MESIMKKRGIMTEKGNQVKMLLDSAWNGIKISSVACLRYEFGSFGIDFSQKWVGNDLWQSVRGKFGIKIVYYVPSLGYLQSSHDAEVAMGATIFAYEAL